MKALSPRYFQAILPISLVILYVSWRFLDVTIAPKSTTVTVNRPEETPNGYQETTREENKALDKPFTAQRALGKPKGGKKYLLIYNNVPKCGSRSLAHTIKDMFQYRRINDVNVSKMDKRNISVLKKAFTTVEAPAYISGHMPFIALQRSDVAYINLVRDPIDRFLSLYYFAINGDKNGVKPVGTEINVQNKTIDEYVMSGGKVDTHIYYYFIEDTKENRNLKIEDAIQQSKQNIEKYYTLVGITEEMLNTMKLLEKLFPELLPRIHKKYINKNKERKEGYTTLHKVPPSKHTVSILKEKLKREYDLYYFIKGRFTELKRKFRINHK
ncbi:uronyl 2-sulfotransferase-like isoform X2 [Apostichopus japonicus]|uniref:uronyl 2-sulfotransferase-like isoform X2 n=1 Tax=Stichopus japonicus TaxID=307972 RepID=UPI003AB1538A